MIVNILSIAGTDPTGGAGIHADIKSISANGGYAMAVITAVVAQNTLGVQRWMALDADLVAAQIDSVFADVRVDAVKIGMVANAAIAEAIADRLRAHRAQAIVLDPVMLASSGDYLIDQDAVDALQRHLYPLTTLLTPNLPEASALTGTPLAATSTAMHHQALRLLSFGCQWVLLKGGHHFHEAASVDVLCNTVDAYQLSTPRIDTTHTHGTGCTLSSAIATQLPTHTLLESVSIAKAYVCGALAAGNQLTVGHGHGPVHHFYQQQTTGSTLSQYVPTIQQLK